MKRFLRCAAVLFLLAAVLLTVPACQTLREVANLREVDFRIDRVARARLAGVDLSRIRSYEDVRPQDMTRFLAAMAGGEAPLEFVLHLNAENPRENGVSARLVEMDWTLLLDDTETVSGTFDQNIAIGPGQTQDIGIPIQLDLFRFFDRSARDLVELAAAVSGQGGAEPKRISLRAQPTIQTPLGAIRYPRPITVEVAEVGGESVAR